MKGFLFFIAVFFMAGPAPAQKPVVALTADKSKIVIGEPIQLTLSAVFKKGMTTSFFSIDSIPHFDIIKKSEPDSQVTEGGLELHQQITVTSWDSGRWVLPPFTLSGAATEPVSINVSYTDFNIQQPYHDIKPIIEVAPPPPSNWPWYGAGILLLLVLFALFFPGSKKEKPKGDFIPEKGAYKKALKALTSLDNSVQTREEGKLFFTRLTDVFRQYLWERRGIASTAQTTAGLGQLLEALPWPDDAYEHLMQTLELSDSVKFAQATITAVEAKKAKETIRQSIIAVENVSNGI